MIREMYSYGYFIPSLFFYRLSSLEIIFSLLEAQIPLQSLTT
nr:MAG TPA_asm: hypothetical protein [Caudoviricetes sp.]